MRRIVEIGMVAIALSGIVFLHPASAARLSVSLPQLAEEAEAVCRGIVKDVKSEWNEDRTYIWTFVTLNVSETIMGQAMKGTDIEMKVPGGYVDGVGQVSFEGVSFQQGEEAVVFLKRETYKGKEYYGVVRLGQGKFAVRGGKVNGTNVGSFLGDVKRAIQDTAGDRKMIQEEGR